MNELIPFPTTGMSKAKILAFEHQLKANLAEHPEHERDNIIEHIFAPGLYARAMLIPAGTVVVGKAHKTGHLNMLVMGTISIATEDGVSTLSAPYNVVSKPHVKRIAYAHTDSIWVTFHVTQLTDVDEIERLVIMPESDYLALATSEEAAKLANLKESKEEVWPGAQ